MKNTGAIKTPAEKILDFLIELKDIIIDVEKQLDLDYCIEKIASN
jgi:3',5'-cyclic-nucleotide phosphodiesterase/calcium/calmodulin-dependent 3',5'-cyclic nucleotide phosphodiesterase